MENTKEFSGFSGLSKNEKKIVIFLLVGLFFVGSAAILFGFNLFPKFISALLGATGIIFLLFTIYFLRKTGGNHGK
jgi:hypothetical protein